MPDSARQNAQHGAPAPLAEFGRLVCWKKREHEGGVVHGAPFLVISVLVLLGTYGAVGGTFVKIKSDLRKHLIGEAKFCSAKKRYLS